MYPTSELYKSKIKELERTFEARIQIQHSLGVLNLTDKDIVSGSLTFTERSQAGEDFAIGGTVASDVEFAILNKPEYADIEFMGATVLVSIGLELMQGIGLTYEDLKQYTYEQLKQFTYGQLGNDVWEYVPLGVFNIDDVNKQRNTIQIKAIDNMINLDKPYSLSQLGYPATLFQIYVDICNICDVMPGAVDFPNKNYVVQERPVGDYSCRDILGYIAELSGTFARMNRHGALELTWYKPTGLILTPANRFNFKPRDDKIRITGVIATVDDTTYIAGTDEYVVDLSENPLLQSDYETVLPNIYNNIKDTEFTPFESNWQGNPALQAGDMITQIDRDGKVYPTLVTFSKYKYRGSSTLKAEGLPIAAKGYKGSTNKKITNIIRKEIKPIGDQLTTLEQAQLHATQLIANMLGGYAIQTPEAFYVADNPDLQQAQKVWKFGLGGFGYSENGVEGPYETAVTADGTIVAMLVAAGIVTADMIQTGELRSVAGNMRIDLDNNIMQIADNLGHNRVLLGEYEPGKFGIQIKDSVGNRTLLDDKGLLNSWQENMTENFDSNHPAKLKFYLPPNAGEIIDLKLSFSLEKFRSYVDTVFASLTDTIDTGIAFIVPRSTSDAGTHSHGYNEFLGTIEPSGSHSHTIDLRHSHNVDMSHNHELRYAVFEGDAPSNVGIRIDGVDITEALGGPWSGEIEVSDLNIKPYITTNGWHTIEFFMPKASGNPAIGRVVANIFGMIFMYAPN